jgi:hypothetical protein
MPTTGANRGLGLFDSGLDLAQWGFLEWGIVIFGVYAASSLIFDVKRGVSGVSKGVQKRSSRRRKIASLEQQLREAKGR